MKIGICGTGSIGKRHIKNISHLVEVNNWYFLRRDGQSDSLSNELNAKIVKDFDELLAMQIDAVIIANPSNMHARLCIDCLRNNIAVYVEKPIAININELEQIENEINKRNKLIIGQVGCNMRYLGSLKRMKES